MDLLSYAMGKAAAGGGGGGGVPNRVQVVSGTVNDPFGDVDVAALAQALQTGDADAELAFEAEGESWTLGVYDAAIDDDVCTVSFWYSEVITSSRDFASAAYARVDTETYDGETEAFPTFVRPNGGTQAELDTDTPCTLTIRWHPMPGEAGT